MDGCLACRTGDLDPEADVVDLSATMTMVSVSDMYGDKIDRFHP
jgi:hypothetical protein